MSPSKNGAPGAAVSMSESEIARSDRQMSGSGVTTPSGTLFNNEDFNAALNGQNGAKKYEEMRRSDAEIASGLARIVWPLIAANWSFEPADDSDQAKLDAEFCAKWIFGEGRIGRHAMRKQDFIRHALIMVSDGFSAFEKVWGISDDGYQVYTRLAPILPKSVYRFQFTTDGSGGLDYMEQRAYTATGRYETVQIPAEKLALFVFGREGDNLFGWPILRACYKSWYLRDVLLRVDAMRHERWGMGIPAIAIEPGANADVKSEAEKVLQNLRSHDQQYMVYYKDQEFRIEQPSGTGTDVVESIKYSGEQISQVLFAEFMHLGASESGSRAVASSKIDLMLSALQGIASLIASTIDVDLVDDLMIRNFGTKRPRPRCRCEDLSKLAGPALAEVIAKLMNTSVGAITPGSEVEETLRKELQLPAMPDSVKAALDRAREVSLERKAAPPQLPPPNGAPGEIPPANDEPPVPAKFRDVPGGAFWREPSANEGHVLFAEMRDYLDSEPTRLWASSVKAIREDMIRKTAQKVSNLSDADLRAGRFEVPLQQKMASALYPGMSAVYLRGRREVVAELSRTPGAVVKMAEGDEVKPTAKQYDWIRSMAALFVTGMASAMKTRALVDARVARQAELPIGQEAARVEAGLRDISEKSLLADLRGAVSRAFVTGREEQADAMKDQIETAFYSAIMDEGTMACFDAGGTCFLLDGTEHEVGDPAYDTPNKDCVWPSNCRCVNVYVSRAAQEAA